MPVTLARHNVIRYQAIPTEAALLLALDAGVICHIDGEADAGRKDARVLPEKPRAARQSPVPSALGFASAHALPASEAPAPRVPQTVIADAFISRDNEPAPPVRVSLPPQSRPPKHRLIECLANRDAQLAGGGPRVSQ